MKLSTVLSLGLAGISALPSTWAFPAFAKMDAKNLSMRDLEEIAKRFGSASPQERQVEIPSVGRKHIPDADHPFQAPSATAQRGPCPGLNIMANYGYIDREGITSFSELIYGQQEFMGWALDLATLLASIAVAVDGNPLNGKVSIGDPDARVGTIPLVGSSELPGGIMKHDAYEIDSSLTRDDKYLGNNKVLNGTLFQQIWDVADEMNNGVINAAVMVKVRSNRYEASARDNPQFTFAPIGLLFLGADHFLWNTMVSSLEDGEPGPSTRETLSSFYGAKATSDTTWEYVPEELPADWYRRARPLSIAEAVANALPSLTDAVAKGQLPTGISADSFASPEAFTCALKTVALGEVPAGVLGISAVGAFLTDLGNLASTC